MKKKDTIVPDRGRFEKSVRRQAPRAADPAQAIRLALKRFGSIPYFEILYWMIRFVVASSLAARVWLPLASFRASMIRERS